MVLLILAVIWAAVLIPPALRARAAGRPSDSITAFHHQLNVLRRAGPRGSRNPAWVPPAGAGSLPRRHVSLVDPVTQPAIPMTLAATRVVAARRSARRRRRDVLLALLVAAGTTLVLGVVPALRMLWLVHVAADLLLIAYVGLLIRQRNLATEREMKVRLLPAARRGDYGLEGQGRWLEPESGWLAPEPVLMRHSAN